MDNPVGVLHMATREFESTFGNVLLGRAQRTFIHVDGTEHDYVEVCTGGPKEDHEALELFDTAEDAIESWKESIKQFSGKKYLYWRIIPEIEQSHNKMEMDHYGKWRIYSRFRVLD